MHSRECGEIRFSITPEHTITYISDSMLRILGASPDDAEWIQALKNRPYFFLTEDDIPVFKECCYKAENDEVPTYFEHHMYDRSFHRIKVHGCVFKMQDSNEFVLVEIADRDIDKPSRNDFFRAIEQVYNDVFVINLVTASVRVIRNLNAIGFESGNQINFWDFKKFLLARLVHPDDRGEYLSFLNKLDSGTALSGLSVEFRTQDKSGETQWLQMTCLHQQPDEMFLCVSDRTKIKDAAQMQQLLKTDKVTRIMNREAFEDICCGFHKKDTNKNSYNALLLLEINHFEDYPLAKQDEMLKRTGDLLESFLGKDATYAWFGNKKFIVCFRDLEDKNESKSRINDLFKYLHEQNSQETMPGYSFGYARCSCDSENGFSSAYEYANAALKDAICSGGNTIRDYDYLSSHSHMTKLPHEVKIQTFGYFEVFVDGRPMLFKSKKAKELLAVLVDRRGGYISSGDIISCLWEDEPVNPTTNARCRKVAMLLKNTLAEYDIDYIIESADRQRRLVSDAVDCDLFHFLAGEESYVNGFDGTYMLNYSWAEWTASYLTNIKKPL